MKIYIVTNNNKPVKAFKTKKEALEECLYLANNMKFCENYKVRQIENGYARLFTYFEIKSVELKQ